ncbi:MAG: hypothetical protein QW471_01980 [Candidatus Woesearchaeota archaeon]
MQKQRNFLITVIFGGIGALLIIYILLLTGTILKSARENIFANTLRGGSSNQNACERFSLIINKNSILYSYATLTFSVRNTGSIPITQLRVLTDSEPYNERIVNISSIYPGFEKNVVITNIRVKEKFLVFPQNCNTNGEEVYIK